MIKAGNQKGCDLADIKFALELALNQNPNTEAAVLLGPAVVFATTFPSSLESFKEHVRQYPELERIYYEYRAEHPRVLSRPKKRPWIPNPQAERDNIVARCGLTPPPEGWNNIELRSDPHVPKSGPVMGKITLAIRSYFDVWLPDLPGAKPGAGERHVLVKQSKYTDASRRFFGHPLGRLLSVQPGKKESLDGCKKEDITIWNYTSAEQIYADEWPLTYVVGIIKGGILPHSWCKTVYVNEFSDGKSDILEQRRLCSLEPITTIPRRRTRVNNPDLDPDPDSGADAEDLVMG